MKFKLEHNSYGKSKVRLTKVVRGKKRHELFEMSVEIRLFGDFAASYEAGDNRKVIATDSMKNTVYVLARENSFDSIEAFALILAKHFVTTYRQVESAMVSIEQANWQRVGEMPHSFAAGADEQRLCTVSMRRGGRPDICGGLSGLKVLNTGDSEFHGFVTDRYRTLPDTKDRIMASRVNAMWDYTSAKTDFNATFAAARKALVSAFAAHRSLAAQQTLKVMGEALLNASQAIECVRLSLPNLHRIPFDLTKFGLSNDNTIFVPTDEPHGLITGIISRGK